MKLLLAFMLLFSGVFAHADAVVSGTKKSSIIHLFGEPAQRLYKIIGEAGAQLEDFGQCIELRSQNIVCGYKAWDFQYACALQVDDTGSVEVSTAFICPRP